MTGQPDDVTGFGDALAAASAAIGNVHESLTALEALLLTGQPPAIADITLQLDDALIAAAPALEIFQGYVHELGARNLTELARHLHKRGDRGLGRSVRDIDVRLRDVMAHSIIGRRRAEGLARSLSVTLQQLRATGAIGYGGLLAEA